MLAFGQFPTGVFLPDIAGDLRITPTNAVSPTATASATTSNVFPNGWAAGDFSTVKTPNPDGTVQTVSSELVGTNLDANVSAEILATGLIVAPTQTLSSDGFTVSAAVDFSPLATAAEVADAAAIFPDASKPSAFASAKAFIEKNKTLVIGGGLILGVGFISVRRG